MRTRLLYLVLIFIVFISCEEIFIQDSDTNENIKTFEKTWNVVNDVYPHFIFKQIDWNSIYNDYLPLAQDAEGYEIYDVIIDMLSELQDGHVDLYLNDGEFVTFVSPRCIKDQDAFSFELISQKLKGDFLETDNIYYKIIENNIGYAYIPSFVLNFNDELDLMMNYFSNTDGLILDIRHNSGGSAYNGIHLMSMFIDQPAPFPPAYSKNQLLHPDDCQPHPDIYYNKPVVLLINGKCYSAAEDAAIYLSYPDNITLIGDTTGGGSGYPHHYKISSKASFRVPVNDYRRYDGKQIEWNGVLPDILVPQTKADIDNNTDVQLNYAINYLEGLQ